MRAFYAKKRTIGSEKSLVKLAESKNKYTAKSYASGVKSNLVSMAKDWRAWAKRKLSGPCSQKNGMQNNTSDYPGRCSGALEQSLGYRTYAKLRSNNGTHAVVAGAAAQFIPFTKRGFDYGNYHNVNPYRKLAGYKERIYAELDNRLDKLFKGVR